MRIKMRIVRDCEGRPPLGTVLIVDDSVETCNMMAQLMRHFRHKAECCYGGESALSRIAQDPLPGLVILDHMMPDVDGIEVLRQLRRDTRTAQLPVVMFSAIQDAAFQEYAVKMGATEYWTKAAYDFSQMQAAVDRLMTSHGGGSAPAC
jgi:CheY-like chemotaxis protein